MKTQSSTNLERILASFNLTMFFWIVFCFFEKKEKKKRRRRKEKRKVKALINK
jgi:hypothetical protein